MKKVVLCFTVLLFTLIFTGLTVSSCDDRIEEEPDGLFIKVFSPVKVIEGQEVVINGSHLNEVTTVVFPGGVKVTDIRKISSGDIRVTTPVGIAPEGGVLTVQAGEQSATARIRMTVGNPEVKSAASTFNKYGEIEIGSEITVTGADMEFFEKAVLQGEDSTITVEAIDFIRKSTDFLKFKIPAGFKFSENMEIRVVTCASKVLLLPKIQRPENVPTRFTGEWKWGTDHGNGFVYGAGGYGYSNRPDWGGIPPGGTGDNGITVPAKEQIIFGNAPELSFARITEAGDTIYGTYRFDMTKQKKKSDSTLWSIGELYIDGATLPVNRDYWASGSDLNTFDIIALTENIIVLAHPHEGAQFEDPKYGGMCTMWCFVPKGSSTYPVDMNLTQGQKITLEGIEDIADWWIDPDWFVRVEGSDTDFTFQAADGSYRISADRNLKYFKVDALKDGVPATLQEDGTGAVWVLGDGVGKPSVTNQPGWNPGRGICMAPIGDKKYRLTLIGGEQISTSSINFKFFHQDNWGGEFQHTSLTTTSDIIGIGANDGHDPGNLYLRDGVTLESGAAYEFIVDLSGGNNNAVLTVTKK